MEQIANRRSNFWLITALILVMIALALWATWVYVIEQSRSSTIIEVSGTVLYHSAEDSEWEIAVPGMQIQDGDQLYTQMPDGVVRIVTDDGDIGFQLEPDTLATYTARWNKILEAGQGGLYLDHGMILAETRHDLPESKTRFIIETEAAKATVVGSRLVVQALKGMPTTRVSALEGEIRVEANSDQARMIRTDSQPIQEQKIVLTAAQTVIVYLERPQLVSDEFDRNLGRVLDTKTRNGVEGVVVQVAGAPELFALTDQEGYFVIPGNRIYGELVIAGTTEAVSGDLEIQPFLSRITDQVINGITGNGIVHALVTPLQYPHLAAVTSPDGTFTIEGLPVGIHTLSVTADGFISQVVETTITGEGMTSLEDIQLITIEALEETFLPVVLKNYFQYP